MAYHAPWAKARVQELMTLWETNHSLSQIAEKLDATRNAIAGQIHRLHEKGYQPPHIVPHSPRPKRHQKPKPPMPEVPKFKLIPKATYIKPAPAAPETRPCSLLELDDSRCRWPLGDVREVGFHFCGIRPVEGRPYCDAHCRIAFIPSRSG